MFVNIMQRVFSMEGIMSLRIEDRAVVLFQGDSITDAGRDRQNPDDLGNGMP